MAAAKDRLAGGAPDEPLFRASECIHPKAVSALRTGRSTRHSEQYGVAGCAGSSSKVSGGRQCRKSFSQGVLSQATIADPTVIASGGRDLLGHSPGER